MLKFLRKRTKAIVWTVVIAFVTWGGYAVGVQFQEAARSPGKIFGKEVSFRDYLSASRQAEIFWPNPDKENPPTPDQIEARTWEVLILSHEAKRRGIKVSSDEVREEITSQLAEKQEVFFTGEQYSQWVRAHFREEPREFENQLGEQLRIQKLFDEVRKEAKENPEETLKRWESELVTRAKLQVYREPRT